MEGFKVNTIALLETKDIFNSVSSALLYQMDQIVSNNLKLKQQTVCDDVILLLEQTISLLEITAADTKELGLQCSEITSSYETTEDRVAAMVAALPSISPFGRTEVSAFRESFNYGYVQVSTPFKMGESVFFSGNQLPSENWIWQRTMAQAIEEEKNGN